MFKLRRQQIDVCSLEHTRALKSEISKFLIPLRSMPGIGELAGTTCGIAATAHAGLEWQLVHRFTPLVGVGLP